MQLKYFFICITIFSFALANKPRLLIVYNTAKIPQKNWHDGFVAAIGLLEEKYAVTWHSLVLQGKKIDYDSSDLIFIKSSWNTACERYVRETAPASIPKALLISNTNKPLTGKEFFGYSVLFHETHWYKQFIKHHPHAIHAFGINADIMKPASQPIKKIYDYIMVADFTYHRTKRIGNICYKKGNRLVIGGVGNKAAPPIKRKLKNEGVIVLDHVSPHELAQLYYQSKICYLPSTIQGGSDRSVLEARSCGVHVEIAHDNPKLKELLNGPIYDHHYYAAQLEKGIKVMLKTQDS